MACAVLRAGVACLLLGLNMYTEAAGNFEARRADMVAEIEDMMRDTRRETGRAALGDRVSAAMLKVERHRFVPQSQVGQAYYNRPLSDRPRADRFHSPTSWR